jgi:hypothetical protein
LKSLVSFVFKRLFDCFSLWQYFLLGLFLTQVFLGRRVELDAAIEHWVEMDGSALAHADDSGSQFSLRQFGDCGAET